MNNTINDGLLRRQSAISQHLNHVSGRRHFGPRFQRGAVLAHTLAFNDDVLDEAEFQEKVIGGLRKQDTRIDKSMADVSRLDKQTRGTLEDIAKLQKNANDQHFNHEAITRKLLKFEAHMANERRAAFGSPIQKLLADREFCGRADAHFRKALLAAGERLPEHVARALGEDATPGDSLINTGILPEIYSTLGEYGIWNTFRVRPMGTKQTKLPISTARVVVNAILTEGDTIADDTTKAGTGLTLEVEVLAGLLNVSMQLIDDNEVNLADVLMEEFLEAYANRLDHFCLNADGTANAVSGGMTGVFQGGTAAVAAAGNITTEGTELDDWLRALTMVDPIVLTRPARWWIHPQILARALAVKDKNGRPLFQTAMEAPSFGGIGTILGYPVTLCHAAPSTNAVNAKIAVFGDPDGQVVGVRTDFRFEASDHHKWNTLQRSFRGWGRAGTKIRRATAFAVLTLPAA